MQVHSPELDAAVSTDHTATARVDVIQNGQVVAQLAVHSGTATLDRTNAQMGNFEVEVSDPTGVLTPDGMASVLAPFGTRLQLYRGARINDVNTLVMFANTQAAWAVSTSFGVNNGVVGDPSTGELRLGP